MAEKRVNLFKILINRPIVVYLLLGLIAWQAVDYKKMREGLETRLVGSIPIDYFQPLVSSQDNNQELPPELLADYIYYFGKITEFFPNQGDGYALLGYSYYRSGNLARARRAYRRAGGRNPKVFWNHYNVAILDYESRDFQACVGNIDKALASDPEKTMMILSESKLVYQILWRNMTSLSDQYFSMRLRKGFSNAYQLREICQKKEYQDLKTLGIHVQIF